MIEVVKNSWQPPAGLDPECRLLCVALNRLPGITTWSRCCGHGRAPYRIWFDVTHLAALEPVISVAKEDLKRALADYCRGQPPGADLLCTGRPPG
jgi:hypothetical protein